MIAPPPIKNPRPAKNPPGESGMGKYKQEVLRNRLCFENVLNAPMLEVFLLGKWTVLHLGRDGWSMVKHVWQASNPRACNAFQQQACAKDGNVADARKMLNDMWTSPDLEGGVPGLRPTTWGFNCAMEACARSGNWKSASDIMREMRDHGGWRGGVLISCIAVEGGGGKRGGGERKRGGRGGEGGRRRVRSSHSVGWRSDD